VAEGERSIAITCRSEGGKREMRVELRKRGWDSHDSFSAYATHSVDARLPAKGLWRCFNQAIA